MYSLLLVITWRSYVKTKCQQEIKAIYPNTLRILLLLLFLVIVVVVVEVVIVIVILLLLLLLQGH